MSNDTLPVEHAGMILQGSVAFIKFYKILNDLGYFHIAGELDKLFLRFSSISRGVIDDFGNFKELLTWMIDFDNGVFPEEELRRQLDCFKAGA
jgi:hypothetical protein